MLALTAITLLAACAPSPVGEWTGTHEFLPPEGEGYWNELRVDADGTGDGVLFSMAEVWNEDLQRYEVLVLESSFDFAWEHQAASVEMDLQCNWQECDYSLLMSCVLGEDTMKCGTEPDYYTDEDTMLQWLRI